ncbi:FAD/FMN-containing dehydrogenase/Fe-S oxidoreductase [Amycolatopsis bartoniae]|uniref:Dimethylmenaquinone methyltransferase n=1 Tax=Amycolatopsis bartoniae TaxID=941986 RepID=A0A8H9M3X1_9PSEU|nr:FAD-binding and (Fe-S)-binding domain-containing protein [Amycolatopsis bartoniae]MBB2938013.1 FAD/FMN-containing dehydrogenase/Fe-S oxidoreductase [Amycolatopsis bartoniae]TVT06131.1 FAD-binding oxidoreductase [Amycolatopsis bartoniae]GHF42329.1 dimethylmenaquinone methyltransferase [Amycolatopsis bartoniae]
MSTTNLPEPVIRHENQETDSVALAAALRERVDGEVRFDAGTRAAYSTDASNFRQVPIGVVVPRTPEAGAEAIAVAREHGAPVLSRGGGTSLAGQCTNAAVVLDWSKYCHRLESVDAGARTCVVQPGIVLDDLNRQLADTGLRFGPEPATHPNCTLGGMIGNNSCGATAQRTGKVVDNIAALEVLCYDGTRFWCGPTTDEEYAEIERRGDPKAAIYRQLRALRDQYGDEIRARFPDIPRRVSGYNLDSLLPEHGFDVGGLLVGSESTLVTVLRAELKLVPVVRERTLVVLGYPDVAKAGDAVTSILPHEPIALEGLDAKLIRDEQIKHLNPEALRELPEGRAFLMVQFGADTEEEADAQAHRMLDALRDTEHDPTVAFLDDPRHEKELWQVREAGLGATAHVPHRPDTFEGWEDSAVPPERLGDYLRRLRKLYEEFGYASDTGPALYGHFGQGCVHTRIPFDLYTADGVATYRRFLEAAADLVVEFGGSLSGEHGDGQTRGELLPKMFGPEISRAFGQLKAIFDPGNRMNPGKVVAPAPLDAHLRLGGDWAPATPQDLFFRFPHDGGSFAEAANRCVGVGRCRQHVTEGHQVMCPSYQVTGEEEHSTRGRARLLFEMLNGHGDGPLTDGWRSDEVREALDLCLACKGCKTDCPANVDMATYKAEFLAHHYAGRQWRRPRAHLAMGWLPVVAQLVGRTRLGPVLNAVTHAPLLSRLAVAVAGVERREVPLFAGETLQQWFARRGPRGQGVRGTVLLWPDTFTNHFHPHIGAAAVQVAEDAGWRVTMPAEPLCCGLTWISTGQLATGKKVLGRTARALAPHLRDGGLVLALEPSCAAVFRSDAAELFPEDQDVRRLREQTVTLAELLTEKSPGYRPPAFGEEAVRAVAQVHCHQHAVLGWDADRELLRQAGVDAEQLDSGCCGLAGNFGFEPGHLEVSEACAERVLLPRLRETERDVAVLADGFSCRTQISQLDSGGREAMHLAELLAAAPGSPGAEPERRLAPRPGAPGPAAKAGALAAAGALLWSGVRLVRKGMKA